MGYIKNKINNKYYIGQTKRDYLKRINEHFSNSSSSKSLSAIHLAINKYGIKSFEYNYIEKIDNNDLDEKEEHYINLYNSLSPNGYNMQTGGTLNKIMSDVSKKKMSDSKKRINNPNFGKPRSENTKKKISISKTKENHHFYGLHLNQDHVKKLSFSHKKYDKDLPMYISFYVGNPSNYQSPGYVVSNHPTIKNKFFTSKKLSLEKKLDLAIKYLNKN